jgi:hypothetical protein
VFGVITNLVGGYLGARLGLNRTMNIGLGMQVLALLMLTVPAAWLTVPWVMAAQALSGIAKDLNKMSAKSSIKLLVPDSQQGTLYKWVAILTGSKNALKGVGFSSAEHCSRCSASPWRCWPWRQSGPDLDRQSGPAEKGLGKAKAKPKFRDMLSKSRAINILSAARLFLFGARDVWFVVALPVYLSTAFGWDFWLVGGFLAAWIIGYGIVQSFAPHITGKKRGHVPDGRAAFIWALALAGLPAALPGPIGRLVGAGGAARWADAVRCAVRGELLAAQLPDRQLRQGRRRLAGCRVLLHVQRHGAAGRHTAVRLGVPGLRLQACLWVSSIFVLAAALISLGLPRHSEMAQQTH